MEQKTKTKKGQVQVREHAYGTTINPNCKKIPFLEIVLPPSSYPQWHSSKGMRAFCESRHWGKDFALDLYVYEPAAPGCYERQCRSLIGPE